jgi:hypothetical protein
MTIDQHYGMPAHLSEKEALIEKRAASYKLPPAQARARAMQELGFPVDEIAEYLDVTESAVHSYTSKVNSRLADDFERYLLHGGGTAVLLAAERDWDLYQLENKRYITAPLDIGSGSTDSTNIYDMYKEVLDAPLAAEIQFIAVETGGPSGEPVGSISVESTHYRSLRELIEERFFGRQFAEIGEFEKWHGFLSEALGSDDLLPTPDGRTVEEMNNFRGSYEPEPTDAWSDALADAGLSS